MLEVKWNVAQVREGTPSQKYMRDPAAVRAECCDMATMAQEAFVIVTMDARNKMIARHLITLGLVDQTAVHPREVFRPAILDSASSIILVHNHPSGDTTPSAEDLRVTRQLVEASRILGIRVVDHIIIAREGEGRPGYLSIREKGLATFDGV